MKSSQLYRVRAARRGGYDAVRRGRSPQGRRRWMWACVGILMLFLGASCAAGQRGGARKGHTGEMKLSAMQQYWGQRLSGAWVRSKVKNDSTDASVPRDASAHTLTFENLDVVVENDEGHTHSRRWAAVTGSEDVVHIAVQKPDQMARLWRIYLYSPYEMVVFTPNGASTTYYRKGSEQLEEDRRKAAQPSAQNPRHNGEPSVSDTARGEDTQPQETASILTHMPDKTDAAPSAPASASEPAATDEATDSPKELESIFRKIKNVRVAMTATRKQLGERLVTGTWDMSPGSIATVNTEDPNATRVKGVVLKFRRHGHLTMIWKMADGISSTGATWRIEGMYGPELRVILTEEHTAPNRERMRFMDANHFVLDPSGEGLLFVRRDR